MTKADKSNFKHLSTKKRHLAELIASPDCDMTITDMCKEVGISRQTFYEWQNGDEAFNEYLNWLIDNYTDSELANAWKLLIKKMNAGSIEALKLFFELKGKFKRELNVKGGGVIIIGGEEDIED